MRADPGYPPEGGGVRARGALLCLYFCGHGTRDIRKRPCIQECGQMRLVTEHLFY
jgi:hypothetical protein